MKVLWITNLPLPEAYITNNLRVPAVGGWMGAAAKSLTRLHSDIVLANTSLFPCKDFQKFVSNGIHFYLIPKKKNKNNERLNTYWKSICDDFQPDVIHIHGTEYPHSLSFIETIGVKNVVVSIQGLVSIYERYYLGGLSKIDILKHITFRDIIRRDSLFDQHRRFKKRGVSEQKLLAKIEHVIGRTEWDKSHAWAANQNVHYHQCNETLRDVFYEKKWSVDSCENHSLFLSQGHYPIKGLHKVLIALPLILKQYPETILYIAGNDFTRSSHFRTNGFANLVSKMIKRYKLKNNIVFTGILDEEEMRDRYLKSHVFICPSAIENSPNSLGEAQLLGVPCISSFVGGTPEMVKNTQNGNLYRFEEFEMLAFKVCQLFNDKELLEKNAKTGQMEAMNRHNKIKNAEQLIQIYNSVQKAP